MNDSTTIPDGYKRCSRCLHIYPATTEYFHKNRKAKSGLCSYCKPCNCAHAQDWYKNNKEKAAETTRAWYDANKENYLEYTRKWHQEHREHDAQKMKEWRAKNRNSLRKSRQQYYLKNRDKIKEKTREYQQNNPDRCRAAHVRRRARIKNAGGKFFCLRYKEITKPAKKSLLVVRGHAEKISYRSSYSTITRRHERIE